MSVSPEENHGSAGPDAPPAHASSHGRLRPLTPEQRRLLGASRSLKTPAASETHAEAEIPASSAPADCEATHKRPARASEPATLEERKRTHGLHAQTRASRAIELRHAILAIAGLIFVALTFFAGRKFEYVKYAVISRMHARDLDDIAKKYPGVSAEELVETGLAAERRGDWEDMADRLIAAKRKNRALPGVFFRIGRSSFVRNDLSGADRAFDYALKFGENIHIANYYRGLIAIRRQDFPAATRYFEAAANAGPFVSEYYYFWAEALRLDHHPRESIHRYEQAMNRASTEDDAALCRFKTRIARLEAVQAPQIAGEVEEARKAGSLSVDWLMTDAALQLQAGRIPEAAQLISEARDKGRTGLFLTCASDRLFRRAADDNPEIATLIAAALGPNGPVPPTPPAN